MDTSNLKLYSLGIVVHDKAVNNDYIDVCPIEQLSMQTSGLISDNNQTFQSKLKDSNGKGFHAEINSTNYVSAKWLAIGASNRSTAPDVYKSETVFIWKFGDTDEYYWSTIFREPSIRRQETVLFSFSNLKAGLQAFGLDTSYWALVDTRNKRIQLHTSTNDGESAGYDVLFDTKNGIFSLSDTNGNQLVLDSVNGDLTGTFNNSGSLTFKNNLTLKAPNIVLDGDTQITQNLEVNNSFKTGGGGGECTMIGNLNLTGNITLSGLLTSNAVTTGHLDCSGCTGCV